MKKILILSALVCTFMSTQLSAVTAETLYGSGTAYNAHTLYGLSRAS